MLVTAMVDPEQERIRSHLDALTCPFCPRGPFKTPAIHISQTHGIDTFRLREMAGLALSDRICAPETSERLREVNAAHPEKLDAMRKAHGQGQRRPRLTTAARERIRTPTVRRNESLSQEERRAALNRARAAQTPESRARSSEKMKEIMSDPGRVAGFRAAVSTPENEAKRLGGLRAYWDDLAEAKRAGLPRPKRSAEAWTVPRPSRYAPGGSVREAWESSKQTRTALIQIATDLGLDPWQLASRLRQKGAVIPDLRLKRERGLCTIDGCEGLVSARGMCNRHYLRSRRPASPGASAEQECPQSPSGSHYWCQATTTTEACVFCDVVRPLT